MIARATYVLLSTLLIVVLLATTVGCQSPISSDVAMDPPSKTGFRVWDITVPALNAHIQGQVWYPVQHGVATGPVSGSYFRRVDQAIDAPIADLHQRYPLILLADGENAGPDALAWLAEVLVANGYIVAQVRPDLSSASSTQLNYWRRPLEVSALLTSLLASELGNSIDKAQIGFVGYSGGALTGLWLAGAQNADLQPERLVPNKDDADPEIYGNLGKLLPTANMSGWRAHYADPRISAFLFLAPSWGWIFDQKGLASITDAVFVITGDHDEAVSAARNAVRLAQWIPGTAFKELQGHVDHWEFMGFWTREGVTALKHQLPEEALPSVPLEHRRRFVHDEVAELSVNFFNHHLHAKS